MVKTLRTKVVLSRAVSVSVILDYSLELYEKYKILAPTLRFENLGFVIPDGTLLRVTWLLLLWTATKSYSRIQM